MKKIRVGVVFGGKSAEHEVSLQSARNIVSAIDQDRFDVTLLGIDKQGQWHISNASNYLLHQDDPARIALHPSHQGIALIPGKASEQMINSSSAHALAQLDVVFPIVHGSLGEDGSLQGLLRMANIPYVGADVLGSAVCMDKDVTKRLLRDEGLHVAPFITVRKAARATLDVEQIIAKLGLPLFVKPANQGSSVGVSKVSHREALLAAIDFAFGFDHKVIVEQAIIGREIECAVLGNDHPIASCCGEIILSDEFYSYDTKYISEQGARITIPAQLTEEVSERIRTLAIQAFSLLNCSGMARVDVFLTPEDDVIINEVNTLPGFTDISMYPKLWQTSGVDYRQLITTLLELALERHQQNNQLRSSHH